MTSPSRRIRRINYHKCSIIFFDAQNRLKSSQQVRIHQKVAVTISDAQIMRVGLHLEACLYVGKATKA